MAAGDEQIEYALPKPGGGWAIRKVGQLAATYPDEVWVREQQGLGMPVYRRRVRVLEEMELVPVPEDLAERAAESARLLAGGAHSALPSGGQQRRAG